MTKFSPGVFIIGAQKSGTTSLASLFAQNPAVCLSKPKEPNYYTVNYGEGEDWYKSCFEIKGRTLIDASTTYTMCPLSERSLKYKPGRDKLVGVPRRIYESNPDAKIIYIIRDPVARMYSNYWHNVKYGYEKKSFNQAIVDDPLYLEMSYYSLQLEKYAEYFSKKNIMILKFEDLVSHRMRTLNQCEAFISVPETKQAIEEKNRNKGKQYTFLARKLLRNNAVQAIEEILSDRILQFLKKIVSKELPPLSSREKKELMSFFLEDQKQLGEKFGIMYL